MRGQFVHADDFAGVGFDVFNLGNPDEITLEALALRIKELSRSDSRIVKSALPKDDPKKRKPDITKVKRAIGWEPKVKLEEGLTKTLEWFREEIA